MTGRGVKVYVGIAVGRTYDVDFVHRTWDGLSRLPNVTIHPRGNDALVERARSVIATHFLEHSDADVLLTLDTDIIAEPRDLMRLCEQAVTHDLVAAPYLTRGRAPHSHPSSYLSRGQSVVFGGADDTPVPIKWGATGALAVHRRVVQKVAARPDMVLCHEDSPGLRLRPLYLPFPIKNDDGKWILLSEDWAFCQRAIWEGFTVHVNPAVRLAHLGLYAYRMEDAAQPPLPPQPIRITREGDGYVAETLTAPTASPVAAPAAREAVPA